MPRKAEGPTPLTPAERQARKREARKREAADIARKLERFTFALGSIARGCPPKGKPLTGIEAQERARVALLQTGMDWRTAGRKENDNAE